MSYPPGDDSVEKRFVGPIALALPPLGVGRRYKNILLNLLLAGYFTERISRQQFRFIA